jgi:hypothetical protein
MLYLLGLYKNPLLFRRGAETNERSEFVEAGWWKNFKIHHPVTCLRQASSFVCTFGANSLVPPLLARRGVFIDSSLEKFINLV